MGEMWGLVPCVCLIKGSSTYCIIAKSFCLFREIHQGEQKPQGKMVYKIITNLQFRSGVQRYMCTKFYIVQYFISLTEFEQMNIVTIKPVLNGHPWGMSN